MVIGVEDPDELSGHETERRVDVLRLGGTRLHAVRHEPWVTPGDLREHRLHRHGLWRVVRQHHLERSRIVHPQHRLDRLHRATRGMSVLALSVDDAIGHESRQCAGLL